MGFERVEWVGDVWIDEVRCFIPPVWLFPDYLGVAVRERR